ncbi:unnamed protein product [Mytilus edulis]|uniref:Reverse transcriptase domain-containing protein n=1 Tax=Mytilus edulis TaxID=6550 RepID=A0A8S3RJB6_MYTED|nr:unnamed protein product [Mytilus edulis]
MLGKGYMMLYKERIPCFSNYGDTQNTCCRISLNNNVIIPGIRDDGVGENNRRNTNEFTSQDIGNTSIVEHTIYTGDAKPIKLRPYRIPLSKKLDAEEEIRKMAEIGIIEPSSSAWINQPLPRIDDSLAALSGCRWLSTCDLKSGYWQVSVAKEDKHKTAFAIEGGGFWQFKVMPLDYAIVGLRSRLMESIGRVVLEDMFTIFNDIIIFSKTFDEHMDHIDQVFNRLGEVNLKLSPKKCHLQERSNFSRTYS